MKRWFLLLIPALAFAQTTTIAPDAMRVRWVLPTQMVNADGTAAGTIPATGPESLVQTRIQRGTCNADNTFGTAEQTVQVTPDVLMVLFEGLPARKHCARVQVVQEDGDPSNWSATAYKVTRAVVKPKVPTITVE